MWRRPSTILVRDALYAGRHPLTNPTAAATNNETNIVGSVTFISAGIPIATGEWVNPRISRVAPNTPSAPPATDNAMASLTNRDSTRRRVKPSVLSRATSRVRARIDMAMVFAETRRIAKTTAPQMVRMKAFTFPRDDTNESRKACWLSVLVCCGALRNISSIAWETGATSLGDATCVIYHPACPLNQPTDSSRYLVLKYKAREGGSIV